MGSAIVAIGTTGTGTVVAVLLLRRISTAAVAMAITAHITTIMEPMMIAMSVTSPPLCPDEDPCSLVLGEDLSSLNILSVLSGLSAADFEQHSSPLCLQAVHFVVAGLATKPLLQWTVVLPPSGLPHIFAVQHSSRVQVVHLVAAAFARKPVPQSNCLPLPSMLPHCLAAQHSLPL